MSQEYRPPLLTTRQTGQFLLALWALLSVSLLVYVLAFGHNEPWADEWEFVPTLTGNEPVGPFFMHPHNEHRLPLPRLIYIALWKTTHDFRAGMILQVVMLSAMAYRGMRLATSLRGVPSWVDAFIPLSLLHVGHCENLLMGYQICFVLASALACAVLELAMRLTPGNAIRTAILAAMVALALALSGGFGIVLAVPIAAWAGLIVVAYGKRKLAGCIVAMLLLFATVAYCGYYLATYERPEAHPPFELKNWAASLQVSGQFLAISFGIGVGTLWFVVLPIAIIWLECTIFGWFIQREWWLRSAGIAAVLLGVILLSFAIGAGRGGFGSQMGLWPRYSVLGWPMLAAIYLFVIRHPKFHLIWRFMLFVSILAFLPNTLYGLGYGINHDAALGSIAQQLREGRSAEEIVETSIRATGQGDRALRGLPMLHAAKIGPFAEWKVP